MISTRISPRIVTAYEHTPIPVGVGGPDELSVAECERLLRIAGRRRGFCTREYGAVRVAQYCGVVSLGQRLLEILPKTHSADNSAGAQSMLVRMLRLAGSSSVFRELPTGHAHVRERLLDVFISAFFDTVTSLMRGGLQKQYRAQSDDLRLVRGRIHLSRQFGALANRTDVVACHFDELDVDNRWNRIIKSGVLAVLGWTDDVVLRRRGYELLAGLDEVTVIPLELLALSHVTFDRAGQRYGPAVEWVRLIAATQSPSIRAGNTSASGLLFDMNQLFERAVARQLSDQLRPRELAVSKQATDEHLARVAGAKKRQFPLRPDLVIRDGTDVLAIADTKWKTLRMSASKHLVPSNADVYQMVAYASVYGAEELALIYPWQPGLEGSVESSYRLRTLDRRRVTLHVVCVQLEEVGMPVVRGQAFFRALQPDGADLRASPIAALSKNA